MMCLTIVYRTCLTSRVLHAESTKLLAVLLGPVTVLRAHIITICLAVLVVLAFISS